MEIKRHLEIDKSIDELLTEFTAASGSISQAEVESEVGVPIEVKNAPSWETVAPGDTISVVATVMGMPQELVLTFTEADNKDAVLANKKGRYRMNGVGFGDTNIAVAIDLDGTSGTSVADVDTSLTGEIMDGPLGMMAQQTLAEQEDSVIAKIQERFPVLAGARITAPE